MLAIRGCASVTSPWGTTAADTVSELVFDGWGPRASCCRPPPAPSATMAGVGVSGCGGWMSRDPGHGPGRGGPARGYSWPAFEVGNWAGLRHGAVSPRRVDPLAAELVEGLLERRPDLADFPEATWAGGRAE